MSAAALAGCNSSPRAAAVVNGSQSSSGQGSSQSNSQSAAPSGGGNAGGGWVLSAPNSIFGYAKIQPDAATLGKIQASLAKNSAPLGVTGTQVIGVYDDPTHDVYIIFAGYNGSGFDPSHMTAFYQKAPVYTKDGAGDNIVINSVTTDPGVHGGTAGCQSTLIQSGALATESTLCSWMTGSTLGSITYYPKGDGQQMVTGTGPEVLGPVMRDLRNLVEQKS